MNIKMILKASFLILGMALLASGCSTKESKTDILVELGNDPEKVKVYREDMQNLVKEIDKNQPNYKHLPLTEEADFDWFYIETYALWDKNVTKDQFIQNGLQRYPAYRESLEYLAEQLSK
ncbi:hypothetical protein [Sulfurovum sp. TSL1]|uniref:hypothetical protein n=1 Tax=Sulfurovum sp. TSL1 TaxID=2826994 RepID=UPI001CC5F3CD|nr:hypothetical protein [Sulfurovum sp. TSL1]GIT98080.1 hypothetical protein TSL1_09010 [Sulfurovum sp. TSL1]